MISYQWYLSPDQPFNKEELFKLQCCLCTAGIFLDLSWKEGSPVMSISVPEQLLENEPAGSLENDPRPDGITAAGQAAVQVPLPIRRGRPPVEPQNDYTLGRVQHMRVMGVSVETISREIGVSKRTFYRRWKDAERLCLGPDIPFSRWE